MRRSVAAFVGVVVAVLLLTAGAAGGVVAQEENSTNETTDEAEAEAEDDFGPGGGAEFEDEINADPNESDESEDDEADADSEGAGGGGSDGPSAVPDGAATPEGATADSNESLTGGGDEFDGEGNTTGNESTDGEAEDEDDGFFSGMMPDTPSLDPKQWLLDMIVGAYEDIREGVVGLLNELNFVFTGVTAPGSATNLMSWIDPPEPEWEMARNMYLTMIGLMLPFWTLNVMQAFGMDDMQRQEDMLKENGATLLMYPLGWFIIAALCHVTNVWTQALTPSAEEFLASPEGLAQLGIGIILGAVVAKANIIILVIGLFLVMLVWFFVLFVAGTWPLWWTMRSSGFPMLRTWGNYMLTTFGILLLVRGTQALGLRFLFHLPFGEVGPGSLLVYVVITAMGLWFLLYKLLRVGVEKTAAASAFTLGLSHLPKKFSAADAVKSTKSTARTTADTARSTASTVRHAPQKIRNAPSAAKTRIKHAVPNRLGGSSPPSPTYQGSPSMQIRTRGGAPTMAGGSNPSTQSKMVRSDGGTRSDSRSSKVAGSGKPRKRLQRNENGDYTVVDK